VSARVDVPLQHRPAMHVLDDLLRGNPVISAEAQRMRADLAAAIDALREIERHHIDINNQQGRPLHRSYTLRTASGALLRLGGAQ
jgi:hypothetical protein